MKAVRLIALTLLALAWLCSDSVNAATITYSWTGSLEDSGSNPWSLTGDGNALTQSDGAPFILQVHVDELAVDQDGTLNPNVAKFSPSSVLLTIGGLSTSVSNSELTLINDQFSGAFDGLAFDADVTLSGITQRLLISVRVSASTFVLANPAAPDLPPVFAATLPVQFGSSGTSANDTFSYPANGPVSGVLQTAAVPEPSSWMLLGIGATVLLARRRVNLKRS